MSKRKKIKNLQEAVQDAAKKSGMEIKKPKKRYFGLSLKAWLYNILLLLTVIVIMYFAAPAWLSGILYKGLITKLPFVGIVVFASMILWSALKLYDKGNQTRSFVVGFFGVALGLLGWISAHKWTKNVTYQMFAQEVVQRESYLPVDKNTLRFTPRKMAFNKIETNVRIRTEEVLFEHIFPYITDDGFGYVAPILLDGLRPSFFEKNPGFFVYHDSHNAEQVIERVEQDFEIGVEMYYTDGALRQLFFKDFFAVYDDIHYFPLDSSQPNKFTGVAPKIKYKYSFPFFFAKYWAGVTLIDADGTLTELSVEEAQNDARLTGKWIFPMSLARHYVDIQDYRVGFVNTFTSVDGMLSIPEIEHNQYPLVIYGEDGQTYFVIDTEPQGSGRGMYRMYYVNAFTGEKSFYEPPPNGLAIGPRGALSKVYSLPGYNWLIKTGDNSSGNQIAIEPVFLTKKDGDLVRLFYKFSVTSVDMTEVSSTVVIEAIEGGLIKEFKDRDSYEDWLNDADVYENLVEGIVLDENSDVLGQLKQYLDGIEQMTQKAYGLLKELQPEKQDSI